MDISFLLFLQELRESAGDFINEFFIFITNMGGGIIPVAIMAVFYWAIDKRAGAYMLINHGGGFVLNQLAKGTLCVYRPWIKDSRIVPYYFINQYSFPSGHASFAVSDWGSIGLWFYKIKKIFIIPFIILILLIGFSRNWLGVHTPQDIIAGFALSAIWLFASAKIFIIIEKNPKKDIVIAAAILIFIALSAVYITFKPYPMDYAADGSLLTNPDDVISGAYNSFGFFAGLIVGWIIERRLIRFNIKGSVTARILRSVIGIILLSFVLQYFTFEMFSVNTASFLRMFTAAFFITGVYPAVIKFMEQ